MFDVTACIKCDPGTTFAVIADLAGPPMVLVMPSTPTIENICTGLKLSVISKTVAIVIRMKLNDCVTAINFFLSIQSANDPPNKMAGIWTANCTIPINPSCRPEPVSSYNQTPKPMFLTIIVIDEETPDIHKSLNPMKANADHGFREGLFVSLGFSPAGFNKLRVRYFNVLVCLINCICNWVSLKPPMKLSDRCAHSSVNKKRGPCNKF